MFKDRLNEVLLSEKPSQEIYKLIESKEIEINIPEILKMQGFEQHTPYHDKDVLEHTMAVLDAIEPRLNLRMAALLHDISKPDCFTLDENNKGHFYGHHIESARLSKEILKRLEYSEEFIDNVTTLIRYHYIKEMAWTIKEKGIKRFIEAVGEENIDDMISLFKADMQGKKSGGSDEAVQRLTQMVDKYRINK